MPKFFVNEEQIQKEDVKVIGNDVKHIKNVLREKVGNELIICNTSNKKDYLCKIEEISEEYIKCKIEKEFENRKIQFKWYSMEELLGDERIQMVNSDIVEYVKECDSKNNS